MDRMKTISTDEIKSHLTKLFWDIKVNPDELFHLFIGKIDKIGPIDRATFYSRILTSFDWYTILKVVPRKDLKALLDDDILNRIYPKGLKEKYLYARRILSN